MTPEILELLPYAYKVTIQGKCLWTGACGKRVLDVRSATPRSPKNIGKEIQTQLDSFLSFALTGFFSAKVVKTSRARG